ncbi:M67 family metallopeptidase [Sphingomonas panacisoli]|uniref:M67 family metallopeptidase n=1 Tax=Sphingomonas panacisoli TaxID=1813879 RepID=A0A5B8LIG7_9SPHN|nr:M67 family metallopeptidase [Sphingomonas panacisoli]QDZ07696.1 M67 family metallopeptidase [Sphingomonas panacisoli]
MLLDISRAALDAILAEAAASPGVEVCGLLLGEGLRVDEVRSCRNVADVPASRFEIDPQALIAAHKAAREGGPAVIGHYHSHPNGKTEPSARDAAAARRGEVWMIVAQGDVKAWLAVDDQGFERLQIHP